MDHIQKYLNVCENEKERKLVERYLKRSDDSIIYWQAIGEQIPFLIFVFIGSFIFKRSWILRILIIVYIVYGYRVQYEHMYFYDVIYPRWKGYNKENEGGNV